MPGFECTQDQGRQAGSKLIEPEEDPMADLPECLAEALRRRSPEARREWEDACLKMWWEKIEAYEPDFIYPTVLLQSRDYCRTLVKDLNSSWHFLSFGLIAS
jgi:hypothetical protein